MKVGIIGAGKLGCAIGVALQKSGYEIAGIYSRNPESASYLNGMLKLDLPNKLDMAVACSDVIFITVTDDQINAVSQIIASENNYCDLEGKVFIHCSGALTSDELQPLRNKGACVASLHPIQTFADRVDGWKGLYGVYFGFEGDRDAAGIAGEIVALLKGRILYIKKEDKPLYHAAACIISNYAVALSFMSETLFECIGAGRLTAVEALTPLLENTVQNIKRFGSAGALTGPISRGDTAVILKHLREIGEKCPGLLEAYAAMGKVAVDTALEKGSIDPDKATEIYNILNSKGMPGRN